MRPSSCDATTVREPEQACAGRPQQLRHHRGCAPASNHRAAGEPPLAPRHPSCPRALLPLPQGDPPRLCDELCDQLQGREQRHLQHPWGPERRVHRVHHRGPEHQRQRRLRRDHLPRRDLLLLRQGEPQVRHQLLPGGRRPGPDRLVRLPRRLLQQRAEHPQERRGRAPVPGDGGRRRARERAVLVLHDRPGEQPPEGAADAHDGGEQRAPCGPGGARDDAVHEGPDADGKGEGQELCADGGDGRGPECDENAAEDYDAAAAAAATDDDDEKDADDGNEPDDGWDESDDGWNEPDDAAATAADDDDEKDADDAAATTGWDGWNEPHDAAKTVLIFFGCLVNKLNNKKLIYLNMTRINKYKNIYIRVLCGNFKK